jgi:hypothetical protein
MDRHERAAIQPVSELLRGDTGAQRLLPRDDAVVAGGDALQHPFHCPVLVPHIGT